MKQKIETDTAVRILKFLSSSNRLNILRLILDHDRTVNEMVTILKLGKENVALEIYKLKGAGLIKERRRGQVNFYSLNRDFKYIEYVKCMIEPLPCKMMKL